MNPSNMGRIRPREMRETQAMQAFEGAPGRMRPREMREAQAMQAFGGNPRHPQQAFGGNPRHPQQAFGGNPRHPQQAFGGNPRHPQQAFGGNPRHPQQAFGGNPRHPQQAFGGNPRHPQQAFGGNPRHPQQADPPGFISGSKAPRGIARHASQGIFGTGAPGRTSVKGANMALTVKSAQSRRTRTTHGHKAKRRAVAKKAASSTQTKTLWGLPWIQTVGIVAGMLANIAIAASTILNFIR